MEAIRDAGGSLSKRDVFREVERSVKLNNEDRHVYQSNGMAKWEVFLHWYSVNLVKSEYLRKERGTWILTREGEQIVDLPATEIFHRSNEGYKRWKAGRDSVANDGINRVEPTVEEQVEDIKSSLLFENAESDALEEIRSHVESLSAYDFQDLVAALLKAMGYHVAYIARKGPDGGKDIIAYRDPIGVVYPHIRVQVKHRANDKASREEIASLRGILDASRDIGMFVSLAGFSQQAETEARDKTPHISCVDFNKLITHWIENYGQVEEKDKPLLPLRTIHFLAPAT